MKNSKGSGNQAVYSLPHDAFGIPDGTDALMAISLEQATHLPAKQNNVIGLSEDVRLNLLKDENQRLKELVEDLVCDKACQARRIKELTLEKSRLKKALADLILDNGRK